jgi:hypothetical protein
LSKSLLDSTDKNKKDGFPSLDKMAMYAGFSFVSKAVGSVGFGREYYLTRRHCLLHDQGLKGIWKEAPLAIESLVRETPEEPALDAGGPGPSARHTAAIISITSNGAVKIP